MEQNNPYASPTELDPQSESPAGSDVKAMAGLLAAVRCAGIALAVYTLGCLSSFAFGMNSYLGMRAEFADGMIANVLLAKTLCQLVMACAFAYLSFTVWKYSGLISAAVRGKPISAGRLLVAQRSCWYAAAAMALLYVFLALVSVAVTLTAYRWMY
jgi:hypothetical protein